MGIENLFTVDDELFNRVAVLEDVSHVVEGGTDAEMRQLERAHYLNREIEAFGDRALDSSKEKVADIMGTEDYEQVADALEARRSIDMTELPDPDEDALEIAKGLASDLGHLTSDSAKQHLKDRVVEVLGAEDFQQAGRIIEVRG